MLTSERDEHFYQLGLRQFGACNRLRLDPPPRLRDLLRLAAEDEPGIAENGLSVDQVAEVDLPFLRLRVLSSRSDRRPSKKSCLTSGIC